MATPSHYEETRLWLGRALDQTAEWRRQKGVEYPGDGRNARSASALGAAAYYVRQSSANVPLRRLAELVHDAGASGIDLVGPNFENGFPGEESSRVAARYFFDHFAGVPENTDHDELIGELYHAILRDLAGRPHSTGSPLGRRINADDPAPADPLATAIGELRELLRDSWEQRRNSQAVELSRLLGELSDAARAEADANGRLPGINQPTRIPMLRRQLSVALKAYQAAGGPLLEEAQKLVDQPVDHATPIISGVIGALDEIARVMESKEETTAQFA